MINRLIYWVQKFLLIIATYYDFCTARKFVSGRGLLFKSNASLDGEKRLIYCVHLHGLFLPVVVSRNIESYKKAGYDIVVVFTFSGANFPEVKNFIGRADLSCSYLIRRNFGKDFASFAEAYFAFPTDRVSRLVLQNDSIIGPLYDSDYIGALEDLSGQFVGVTESFGPAYHLQSSLLMFNGADVVTALGDFFSNDYRIYNHRENIVRYGEVGLTQFMLSRGLVINVLLPLIGLVAAHGDARGLSKYNSQHNFGEFIFCEYNFPFIKRELLSKNPAVVDFSWDKILKRAGSAGLFAISESMKSRI